MYKSLIKHIVLVLAVVSVTTAVVFAEYIPNSRDTKEAPDEIVYTISEPEDMELLHDNDRFTFYFRDERDVLAIYDKANDFTYKTGMDVPMNDDLEDTCMDMIDAGGYTPQDVEDTCVPIQDLSSAARDYVNSFLVVEYLDEIGARTRRLYSASDDYRSSLSRGDDDSHWFLDVDYGRYDIEVRVHLYFDEEGVTYEIRDHEIDVVEPEKLLNISITPFMGAQGGYYIPFDDVELEYNDDFAEPNPINPGYSFIPDGSGALIRYEDTNIDVDEYVGDVYGDNLTSYYSHTKDALEYLEAKTATLPVFGMSYGDDTEAAFVAYAIEGDEYMQVVSVPLSSTLGYVQTYSTFVYSNVYRQVYNDRGDGYDRLPDDRQHFDVVLRYEFLQGDGSTDGKPASYVGMAMAYREYLLEAGILTPLNSSLTDIPIRVDFLMADSKTGIFGYEEQVATTMDDVAAMIETLHERNVMNLNGGLLGWQDGGMILTSPKDMDFTNSIGSKSTFEELLVTAASLGYDISLSQDFLTINEDMMSLLGDAVKHNNGKYYEINLANSQTVMTEYLAKPNNAVSWLDDHTEEVLDLGGDSITVYGLSNLLYGDSYDDLTITDVKNKYHETLLELSTDITIAGDQPHVFLLDSIERYLNIPVYSTQFIIASDTVPFLQMVIAGTVELYAPYSNFSFSSEKDVLRMIDYNVYPSFVLTQQPSYVLGSTNSNEYISTQFRDYEDLIVQIYQQANDALSPVLGETWLNRLVVENGVIVNQYTNDIQIIINYTEDDVTVNGNVVEATSYLVVSE